MPKKEIIETRLYVGPGDFERNEIQVYIYLPLTIPRSRCRIRKGGDEGEQITSPLNYSITTKDVLEYMTKNEDLAYLLLKLMEADALRDIRRQNKSQGISDDEILKVLLDRKKEFERKEEERRNKIQQVTKLPIADMVCELKKVIIEDC